MESRQVLRRGLREQAIRLVPTRTDKGLIPRSQQRLMARALGNRQFRASRLLPELPHMTRRGGLRK